MQTVQDRLILLLSDNRTIYFCDGCLALKMGAFPREVRDALAVIGRGDRFQLVMSLVRMSPAAMRPLWFYSL